MQETSYELIVQKAVGFMRANLSRPISLPEIAQFVSYSPDHLGRAFRRVTGHGVLHYLLDMKLELARRLLRDTDLSVGEIALNAGFNNHPYFSAAFRRMAGISPMQYRVDSRKSGGEVRGLASASGSAEVFRDALTGPLSQWWSTNQGEWTAGSGYLQGKSPDELTLRCLRRLPENFRISFETYFGADAELSTPNLIVKITDQGFGIAHTITTIGTHANAGGRMEKTGKSSMWNPTARIQPGIWQCFALELIDDLFNVYWDGSKVFSFQDPFPGSYSSHCRIALGSWKSMVRFRNFAIFDLGIQPLVRVVRQGDMLFNEGLYEKAREFYFGLLESREAFFNSMELQYKVGMCFLRQRLFEHARECFAKVVTRPESDFWSQVSRLAEAETMWETGDTHAFFAQTETLSATPVFRDGLRELLKAIHMDLVFRGFYWLACRVCEHRIVLEEDPFRRIDQQHGLAETLWQLNRFQEAEALLFEMNRTKGRSYLSGLYSSLLLADMYSCQGKWEDSNARIEEIEAITQDQSDLGRCAVHRARNLRGQGKLEDALSILNDVPSRFPLAPSASAYAQLVACLTYCAAGDSARARKAIEEARRIDATIEYLNPWEACRFMYVPDLLERNFEQAANCLMQGGMAIQSQSSARSLIHAGVVYELASKVDLAANAYDRVVRLYPANRFCYYAELAQALQRGEYKIAFDMPYQAQFRSELFCLLGLLCEAKGRRDEAIEFFRHSHAEDPTLSWPAALSAKQLSTRASGYQM